MDSKEQGFLIDVLENPDFFWGYKRIGGEFDETEPAGVLG